MVDLFERLGGEDRLLELLLQLCFDFSLPVFELEVELLLLAVEVAVLALAPLLLSFDLRS